MPSASGSSGGGVPPPSTTGDGRLGTGARGAGAGRAPMAPFAPEDAQVGVQLTEMNSFFTLLHTWLLPGASPANTGSERLKKWGPGTHHHTYVSQGILTRGFVAKKRASGGGCTPVIGASGWTTPGARTETTPRHPFSAGSLSAASLAAAAATAAASVAASRAISCSDVGVDACLEAITEETAAEAASKAGSGTQQRVQRAAATAPQEAFAPVGQLSLASGAAPAAEADLPDPQQVKPGAQLQAPDAAANGTSAGAISSAGHATATTAPQSLSIAPADATSLQQEKVQRLEQQEVLPAAAAETSLEERPCPDVVAAARHLEAEVAQPGALTSSEAAAADTVACTSADDATGVGQQQPNDSSSTADATAARPTATVSPALPGAAATEQPHADQPEALVDSVTSSSTTTLAYARNSVSGAPEVQAAARLASAGAEAVPQLQELAQLPPVGVFRRSSECCVLLTDTGAAPRALGHFSRGSTPGGTPTAAAAATSAVMGLRPQVPQADTPGPSCTSSPASQVSPVAAAAADGPADPHAGSTTPTRSATTARASAVVPPAAATATTTAAVRAGVLNAHGSTPTGVDARHGASSTAHGGPGSGGSGFPGFAHSSATWDAVAARLSGSGAGGMSAVSAGRTSCCSTTDWLHRPASTTGVDAGSCDGGDGASVADSTTSIDSGANPMAAAHAARLAFRSSFTGNKTPTLSPMASLDGMAGQAEPSATAAFQQPAVRLAAQPDPAQSQPMSAPASALSGRGTSQLPEQQLPRPPLQHPQLAAMVLRERYASISGGSSSSSPAGAAHGTLAAGTPGAGTPGTKAALLAAEGSAGGSPCSPSLPPPPLCRPNTWSCSGNEDALLQSNLGPGTGTTTGSGAGQAAARAGGPLSAAQQQAAHHLHARERALTDATATAAAAGGSSPAPASGDASGRLPPAGAVLSGAEPLAALPAAATFMPSPRCLACGTASMALTQARLQLEALAARHTQLWRQYERLGATASATEARCSALEETVRRQEAELSALRTAAAAAATATAALQQQERVLQELRAAVSASATAAASVRSGGTTPRSPHTAGSSPRASVMGNGAVPVLGGITLLTSPSPGGLSPSFAPSPASSRELSQTPTPLQMSSPASALAGAGAWAGGGADTEAAARAAAGLRAAGARSLKQMRYPAGVADSYDGDRGSEHGDSRSGHRSNSGAGIRFHTNPLPLLAASGGLSSARESLQEGAGSDRGGVALRSSTTTRLMQLASAAPPVLRSASGGIGRHSRIPVLSMPQLSLPMESAQAPQPQHQESSADTRDAGCATPTRSLSIVGGAVAAKVAALAAAAATARPPGLMSPPGSSGRAAKPVVLAMSPVVPRAMKFGTGMTSHSNPVAAAAEASRQRAKSSPMPWVNITSNPLALEEEEEERRAEGR
eukprot:XP_001695305.1 predicted protein [Chlamydomonas reinhardtii]